MQSADAAVNIQGQLKIRPSSFIWEIHNFSDLMCENKDLWVRSPIFEVSDGIKKTLWQIILVMPEKEDSFIKLHLNYLHDNTHFQADNYCFTFSLINNIGQKVSTRVSNVYVFDARRHWGWPQYIKKSEITNKKDSLLIENTLSVFCEINMNVYSSYEVQFRENLDNVYETFYLNEKFSDVTILVDEEKIKAHRIVLSAKSKVFAAMLEHNMKENNTHIIAINDISLDVIKELLLFMYCGRVNNLKEIAKPLLEAADKYDVSLLKIMCEKSMKENLNCENACVTLVTSDLHDCQKLKTETIDFMIQNITKIAPTSEFMELKHLNPKLLEEIILRIAEQKNSE